MVLDQPFAALVVRLVLVLDHGHLHPSVNVISACRLIAQIIPQAQPRCRLWNARIASRCPSKRSAPTEVGRPLDEAAIVLRNQRRPGLVVDDEPDDEPFAERACR